MEIIPILVGAAVAIIAGRALFPIMFEDRNDFRAGVRFTLTPNLISLFRGEYLKDVRQSSKVSFWMLLSIASGALAGYLVWWFLAR